MITVLLRFYHRDPRFMIIALPAVIILLLIFEKNPRIKEKNKK
jgi:hypothetical protein